MAESDILFLIQSHMSLLSKSHKRLAQYILDDYDKAAFYTAKRMGDAVGISESTVVRFATALGYSGYPELQKELQQMVLNNLTSVQRIEVSNERFSNGNIPELVLLQDIDRIRATLESIDNEVFENAVDAIISAKRIYILGLRASATIASLLYYYFNHMFDNVKLVAASSPGEVLEHFARVEKEDIVISISFPRYSKTVVQATEYSKKRGAAIVAITDGIRSPVASYADYLLSAKMDMVSLVDSLVAPMSLINALIVAIGQKREKELVKSFSQLEMIWDEYEVYEKGVF